MGDDGPSPGSGLINDDNALGPLDQASLKPHGSERMLSSLRSLGAAAVHVVNPHKRRWIARMGERRGVSREASLSFWIQHCSGTLDSSAVELPVELGICRRHEALSKRGTLRDEQLVLLNYSLLDRVPREIRELQTCNVGRLAFQLKLAGYQRSLKDRCPSYPRSTPSLELICLTSTTGAGQHREGLGRAISRHLQVRSGTTPRRCGPGTRAAGAR